MTTKTNDVFDTNETRELIETFRKVTTSLREQVGKVIIGQADVVEHLLVTLLVGGHCLITGMPGTAKTLLVKTLAEALGLKFKRIQFTPDLMPTDVTGTDIIEEDSATGHRSWTFVEGPVFTNVLLADEINRTPPKTQAALLEAMQEQTVTVRGKQHLLPPPFLVLATQNPIELEGTYPLPEAQLDRFLFNVLLDYLDTDDEIAVIDRFTTRVDIPEVTPCTNADEIIRFQWLVRQVAVSESINRFAVRLVRATRPTEPDAPEVVKKYVNFGASVRATMFLNLAAKARALLEGRYHVTEEDVREMAMPVLRHRVLLNYFAESDNQSVDDVLTAMLANVSA
jgi:MoxR-like ATPase